MKYETKERASDMLCCLAWTKRDDGDGDWLSDVFEYNVRRSRVVFTGCEREVKTELASFGRP